MTSSNGPSPESQQHPDDSVASLPPESGGNAPAAPAEDPVRIIVKRVLVALLLMFIYHLFSDRITPYTSQATVATLLVQIAPQVSGEVLEVGVIDNGAVKKGQILFRIDPQPFEIALRSAKANLAVALQDAAVSSADVDVAQAKLQSQRVDLTESRQLGRIVINLANKRALAESNAIRARADIGKTEAAVMQAEAELDRARQKLGATGNDNPKVRQALAALQQAQLDLSYTTVTAPADGVVTNLRLSAGQFVTNGKPLLSFIEYGPRWVSAAMRENQLGNLAPDNRVLVTLDDSPGSVFSGRVESIGWGITQDGSETPTGQLPDVQPAAGWLREAKLFPVRIMLTPGDDGRSALSFGRNGAQATVIVFTDPNNLVFNPIGWLRIHLASLLSYLY